MKKSNAFAVLAGFTVVFIILIALTTPTGDISEDELYQRVERTSTDWSNYHEDLKGQIGSTPVARWKGDPISSQVEGNTITIVFEVTGYWAEIGVNLPVIIRDPLGKTFPDNISIRNGSKVTYTFVIPGDESKNIPWIELKYPHATRRIAYIDQKWEAFSTR